MYLGKIVELGAGRGRLHAAGASLHRGAAVGGAGARPGRQRAARADRAAAATCRARSTRRAAAASTRAARTRPRSARPTSRRWSSTAAAISPPATTRATSAELSYRQFCSRALVQGDMERSARLAVLVCALAIAAIGPDRRLGGAHVGAGVQRGDPSGRPDLHRRRPVHRELRLLRRVEHVYIGQAAHCSGTGGSTETNGCDSRLAAGRHAGRGRRRQQARDHGLQLVADDAGQGRDRPRHLRSTTTSRWSSSTRPTSPTSTRRSRTGAARRASTRRHGAARQGLLATATPSCAAASPSSARSRATASATTRGGWTHTVYTVTPGIPGDSGSAFLDSTGAALGVLSTVAIAPVAGLQRRRRRRQGARLRQQRQRLQRPDAGAGHRALRGRLPAVGPTHRCCRGPARAGRPSGVSRLQRRLDAQQPRGPARQPPVPAPEQRDRPRARAARG